MINNDIKSDIASKLNGIMEKRFNINISEHDADILDKHLLGEDMGFAARDLLYLFFDVENVFNVKIDKKYILNGKFTSFNNIVEIIYSELHGD